MKSCGELPYAFALGHPLGSGAGRWLRHAKWFVGAVENFRFFDLKLHPFAEADAAVAEVKAEGIITATGRTYRQEYVVFLRCGWEDCLLANIPIPRRCPTR